MRRARIARFVSAAGVALTLGACSGMDASQSPTTVSHGTAVTPDSVSTTTDPSKRATTTTTVAGTDSTKTSLSASETNQINNELAELQSLLGDTSTDFVAGQKEN